MTDVNYTPEFDPADVDHDYGHTGGDIPVPQFTADMKPFKFWCQKALPLVYDDSLSYYEVLCKVVNYMNGFLTDLNTATGAISQFGTQFVINQTFLNDMSDQLSDNVGDLESYINDRMDDFTTAYNQLQAYVNSYFDNLDVQEEINTKLDEMAEDGTFNSLFDPVLVAWIEQETQSIDDMLAAQNATLATQNGRISVLEGRMSTFASLPAGSTSGNAELVDIRTNFLGETYANAGEAVRNSDMISSGYLTQAYIDDEILADQVYTGFFNIEKYKGGKCAIILNNLYQTLIPQGFQGQICLNNSPSITGAIHLEHDNNTNPDYPLSSYLDSYTEKTLATYSGATAGYRILVMFAIPSDCEYDYIGITYRTDVTGAAAPNYIPYATYWSKTPVDNTLTQAGEAADAKAAGDAIREIQDIFTIGTNMFNKDTVTDGVYLSSSTGMTATLAGNSTSDWIPAEANMTYIFTSASPQNQRWCAYDSNKVYLEGHKTSEAFTTPAGTAYLRVSTLTSVVANAQLEKGNIATEFQPYHNVIKSSYLWYEDMENNVKDLLEDFEYSIDPDETTFFYVSKNMVNPDDNVVGEFVNQSNGTFATNANYTRTDYIPVRPSEFYYVTSKGGSSVILRYAFYDKQKTFISGAMPEAAASFVLASPPGAWYLILSTTTAKFPIMLAKGSESVTYEDYTDPYIYSRYTVSDVNTAIINIPDKIYATAGIETNVYFENITENWNEFSWDISCTKGKQMERCFTITPVDAEAGTYDITFIISPIDNPNIKRSKTVSLIITAASAGSGATKSIIILGDSTTDNGIAVTKLNQNFANDAMNIQTLGTRGTAPNNEEGRSGWTFEDYFTKASITYTDGRGTIYNPFYNPTTETFDASYYFSNSGISVPDWFFINLGINDMFNANSDKQLENRITPALSYLSDMIDSLQAAAPNMKIGVCVTIPPNHSQDAFGKAYGCSQHRNRYKRNNTIWASRILTLYSGQESNGIYIVPIHTNLDTVYNMGLETMPVNARNTAVTYESAIANGGVHPVESGYWQIADIYTAFLKANV